MKVKEIAAQTGLKERTIRFYEEHDLIRPAMERRNGRNYREYTQEDADRLRLIATLRRSQFTLEEIRQLLELPDTTPQIFRDYTARMEQSARSTELLWKAASTIPSEGLTPQSLAQSLERQVRNLSLPPADLEPHFGKSDPETPMAAESKKFPTASAQCPAACGCMTVCSTALSHWPATTTAAAELWHGFPCPGARWRRWTLAYPVPLKLETVCSMPASAKL